MRPVLSATDASEQGGGACEARAFVKELKSNGPKELIAHYAGLTEESGVPMLLTGVCHGCAYDWWKVGD